MAGKTKSIYPRTRKDMLRIIKAAEKRGTPDGNAHRGVLRTCICDAGVVGLPQLVL